MPPGACAGGIAVVIDVLRASTTIITALAHGAAGVRPVADVASARELAGRLGPVALLGGERGAVRIEGFDCGNSPLEYTRERVAGREVVITTTNGTAALAACLKAQEILVAAVVNRAAAAAACRTLARVAGCDAVHLVCAGTDGQVTAEDVLAAGGILEAAARDPASAGDRLDPAAIAARDRWREVVAAAGDEPRAAIIGEFRRSLGGANLVALGMDDDLIAAAALDALAVVPRFDRASGRLG